MPPYFKQLNKYACSLAVLRSVLGAHDIQVSEEELIANIGKDYGSSFKNIWNPTIARIAREYNIETQLFALWPLLRPKILSRALREYINSPNTLEVNKYENPNDKDGLEEQLPIAYKDTFEAIRLGCKVTYGGLTKHRLKKLLGNGYLVQTSIRNAVLYKGGRNTFHSLLLYKLNEGLVTYHDPAKGSAMTCTVNLLLRAANGTGAFLVFKR